MSDAVLSCQGLSRHFSDAGNTLTVLNDVSFSVAGGESAAIVGASGSGKSTLLHLLGGLDVPDAGTVSVGGVGITDLGEAARGRLRNRELGFVYQFHHLLPEFTALENVAMPLLIRREPSAAARAQAAEWLSLVGLSERAGHKPAQLSGGERQRVAVARALVSSPSVVLADEPTGNLDAENAERVFDLLLDLKERAGTSIVVVTHDEQLARRMDRVWQLSEGRLAPI